MKKVITGLFAFTLLAGASVAQAADVDLTVNGASQTTVSGGDALNFSITSDAPNRRVMLMVAPDCINYQRNAVGRTDANNEFTLNITVPNGLSDSSYCFEAFGQTASGVKRSTPVTVNVTSLGGSDDSDITPDVVPSRVSGYAPLAVYFDAKGTTHEDGSIRTFHELHYRWNFGDPLSGVWSTNQKSRNTAEGPITGHLFETPGEFTVSLTVKDANGDEATKQTTITVLDPNNPIDANDNLPDGLATVCVAKDTNFDGCPEHADEVTYTGSTINTKIAELLGQGKRRILLQEDETFEANWTIKLNVPGPGTLGSFGPMGKKAKIALTSPAALFRVKSEDWRIYDLEVTGNGTTSDILDRDGESIHKLLVSKLIATPGTFNKGFIIVQNGLDDDDVLSSKNAFVGNNVTRIGLDDPGNNIVYAALRDSFFMGNTFWDSTGGEHIIRMQHVDGGVWAHNRFGHQANDKAVLNFRAITPEKWHPGVDEIDFWTQNMYVAHNYMSGSSDRTFGMTSRIQNGGTPKGRNAIIERNRFSQHTANTVAGAIGVGDSQDVTIRNNIIECNEDEYFGYRPMSINLDWPSAHGPDVPSITIVGNTICDMDVGHASRGIRVKESEGKAAIHNNLLYAPHAGNLTVVQDLTGGAATISNNMEIDSINDNPFVSPNPGANPLDYRLVLDSAPVNAGVSVDAMIEDFEGTPRDANPDIGAFEYSQ